MNTRTIIDLAKSLRAFSVFFVILSVLVFIPPLSILLCDYAEGHDAVGTSLLERIHSAIIFSLIGMILFCCYQISRRQNRGVLATLLLWSATLAAGIYGANFTYGFLRWMAVLFHLT
jgi:uncharacterized BrkB/YihY/UPF0761 family membrane protein